MGAGIAVYFSLPSEPPSWIGASLLILSLLFALATRASLGWLAVAAACCAASLGFAATQWRTGLVAAPMLTERIGPVELHGRVLEFDALEKGYRLTLDRLSVPGLSAERTPERIRIRVRAEATLRPGQRIAVRAILLPPSAPAAPGAFDFQFYSFFQRLGATGFTLSAPRIVEDPPVLDAGFVVALTKLRHVMSERIKAPLDAVNGPIAAALITGERSAIPEATMAAIRDAGLAHLLAISGMNIALVAGFVFAALRIVLALIPALALRYPIKKWAAVASLIVAFLYMVISGSSVPTQRAVLMLAIVVLGVLLDRVAISMRLAAWAAVSIMLLSPEAMLGPSFQMSFAAVIALIAMYEALRARLGEWSGGRGWLGQIVMTLALIAATSFIAGLATAPYAIFHFNRYALYGVAANMIAVPISSFWVMPWGLIAMLLMPIGLETYPLIAMGWGVDVIVWSAELVAAWPGAVQTMPAMPSFGLALASLGGLWIVIWRRKWRWLGVPAAILGIGSTLLVRQPDMLIAGDGQLIAVRDERGRLLLSQPRGNRFSSDVWLQRDGQTDRPLWPDDGDMSNPRLACDPLGCIYRHGAHVVALVRDRAAFAEDCRRATLILTPIAAPERCLTPAQLIDRAALLRNGSYALWFDADRLRTETVRDRRGERPWVLKSEPEKPFFGRRSAERR